MKDYEVVFARQGELLERAKETIRRIAWASKIHIPDCSCQSCENIAKLLAEIEAVGGEK